MNSLKKIIPCFLLFATLFPTFIGNAHAVEYTSPSDFWTWTTQYAWELVDQLLGKVSDSVCTESDNGRHYATSYEYDAGNGYYRCICQYCGESFTAYASDLSDAYSSYVTDLETDLGTTTLIDGGVRVYFEPQFIGASSFDHDHYIDPTISGNTVLSRYQFSSSISYSPSYNTMYVRYKPVTLPFQVSSWTLGYDAYNCYAQGGSISGYTSKGSAIFPKTSANSGNTIPESNVLSGEYATTFYDYCLTVKPYRTSDGGMGPASFDFSFACYADLYPNTEFVDPDIYQINISSRPTSIVGDYGIVGDDGTIVHVEGNMIVDESTNIVYNPVTNTTYNFTDYAYDYSDRSYNLTLEDGSSMKVVYGDENITIHEGDTVYNVYYLIPSEDTPSTDPDTPTEDNSGWWAWWKDAWTSFTDRFFLLFGNGDTDIENTLPGDEDNAETEEDEGWSIIDLFKLLRDALWKIITGVLSTALNGFLGLVDAITSLGGFFDVFDRNMDGGVLDILNQGGAAVWE